MVPVGVARLEATADYPTRTTLEPASKRRIAAAAARLIRHGTTVILDGGTTTLALTRTLPADLRATVITHSPTVAAALIEHGTVEVFLLGGRLFKHYAVTCGAAAVEAAQQVSADLFFLGVTGVHATHGLTTGDPDEAAMKRALAGRAAGTYVLASTEKVGAVCNYQVLPLSEVAGIVTDAPPGQTTHALKSQGITLLDAPSDHTT